MAAENNLKDSESFKSLLDSIDENIYQRFKTAVEIGRWANGEPLTNQQKQLVFQALIAYEHKHLPETERTGVLPRKNNYSTADANADTNSNDSTNSNLVDHDTQIDTIRWKQ